MLDMHTITMHGICSIDYYRKAVNYINQQIDSPIFYIFSDDIKWCKDNLNFIEKSCFVDNTKTAIDDLVLMQNCQSNIIANSTFSWWGAWLKSEGVVIAPKQWFTDSSRFASSIFPSKWLQM